MNIPYFPAGLPVQRFTARSSRTRGRRGGFRNQRWGGFDRAMLKYHDEAIVDASLDSTDWVLITPGGSPDNMVNIALATGPTNRLGKHVHIHSINMRWSVRGETATATGDSGIFTIAVVLDTQTNKAQCVANNIWDVSFPHDLAFRDLEHSQRFRILYKKTVAMNVVTQVDDTADRTVWRARHGQWYKTYRKPIKIDYDAIVGSEGTIDEQTQNSIHIFCSSDVTDEALQVSIAWRIRFDDVGFTGK